MRVVVSVLLAAAIFVAASAAAAATAAPDTYVLQYAVGNSSAPKWRQKATLLVTEHRVRPEDAATAWTYADVKALREGHPYRLRIVDAKDADSQAPHVFASARLSPCTLLTAKQYANTPLRGTYERIGVSLTAPTVGSADDKKRRRPTGIRMVSNFVDTVCELAVFAPALKQAQKAAGQLEPEADHLTGLNMNAVVQAANPITAPAAPPLGGAAAAPVGADGKPSSASGDKKVGADGKVEQEPDNRSFFEKYWLYIVMFLGYSVVSSLFAPPPQAGEGGDAKGAAKAVKK